MSVRPPRRPRYGRVDQAIFAGYLACHGLRPAHISRPKPSELDLFAVSLFSTRVYWANCFASSDEDGRAFRVMPAYVMDPSPNAFADVQGDVHLCGLNIGLAAALFELASFTLAQAVVLPEIGDAAAEASPVAGPTPPGFSFPRNLLLTGRTPRFNELPTYFPADPARQAAAVYLTLLMLRFVWFHELYHGLNGHVRFLQNAAGLRLDEAAEPPTEGAAVLQRTMELDADQSAFFVCAGIQNRGTENIRGIQALDRALRLRLTLLGAYLTTWMFDEQARRRDRQVHLTHPAPYPRLHNLLRCAAAYLADDVPDLAQINRATLGDLVGLSPFGGSAFTPDQILADMQSEGFQAELDAYDALNEKIQPTYHRFSYR